MDVETDRRIDLNIARHFFLPEEYEALRALSLNGTEEWHQAFLRYWTLKESCLKCLGTGLSGDIRKVDCAALLRGEGPDMEPGPLGQIAGLTWRDSVAASGKSAVSERGAVA